MLRILVAGLLTAMLTACGYGSDIDLTPKMERVPKHVVASGDYCEVRTQPPYTVKSSADCVRLAWSQADRAYTMTDPNHPEEPVVAAVSQLDSDLYIAQVEDETDEAGGRYHINLMMASGSAMILIPALGGDPTKALADLHPGVTWRFNGSTPVIGGGSRSDIRAFLRASARKVVSNGDIDDEEFSFAIRDTAGIADHPASKMQIRDIKSLLAALRRLQPGDTVDAAD